MPKKAYESTEKMKRIVERKRGGTATLFSGQSPVPFMCLIGTANDPSTEHW